jgi:deoxyribodipyrimidine photo-lyase
LYWNRRYEPTSIARDSEIKSALRQEGVTVKTFNSALLNEPWTVKREGNQPYRVFTPYWKAVQKLGLEQLPISSPNSLPPLPANMSGLPVGALKLLPKVHWDLGLRATWHAGEKAAEAALQRFLDTALNGYADNRDRPDLQGTSRLSPHLHFGEISPRQILNALRVYTDNTSAAGLVKNGEAYIRELVWREFAHHLLYHFPHTADRPLDERFERFAWATDYGDHLKAWQQGQTGYPLVDAGMRELWHTGWMHNRVRMVVASFLTKNLLIPWQEGARWFWDTLVDANLANNTLGWQWTAGCGADAAPYFRVFNPVLQGERFDPNGDYVRRWVPELSALPAACIHKPWTAPPADLERAGVQLGVNYPFPLVDLSRSREQALAEFDRIKSTSRS